MGEARAWWGGVRVGEGGAGCSGVGLGVRWSGARSPARLGQPLHLSVSVCEKGHWRLLHAGLCWCLEPQPQGNWQLFVTNLLDSQSRQVYLFGVQGPCWCSCLCKATHFPPGGRAWAGGEHLPAALCWASPPARQNHLCAWCGQTGPWRWGSAMGVGRGPGQRGQMDAGGRSKMLPPAPNTALSAATGGRAPLHPRWDWAGGGMTRSS